MSNDRASLAILHTAAHPADAFDMVGGTLAHHIRMGDQVTIAVFTHGARSHALEEIENLRHHDVDAVLDDAVLRKEGEVRKACRILGIEDVRFLHHDDHLLLPESRHILAVAALIQEVRPDVVITHSPFEAAGLSSTHHVCCDITLQGCEVAAGLSQAGLKPHRVGEIFYTWLHGGSSLLDFAVGRFPSILVDVTDVINLKLDALDCIESQYYSGKLGRKMAECINGAHGLHMCVPYCEAFMRHYPEVLSSLPISQHNLRIASDPLDRTYARVSTMVGDEDFSEGDPRGSSSHQVAESRFPKMDS